MKKIYFSILSIGIAVSVNAQLTLTKVFNEPVIGNIDKKIIYDSVGVIPKSSGTGQIWNFSTLTTTTGISVSNYTTVASTPSASSFPGSTLAEGDGTGGFNYWKSTASTYELTGFASSGNIISFTNTGIAVTWPVNFGYSATDAYAGTANISSMTGPANGTLTSTAPGSGTVTLPGSLVFTNCLQFKVLNKLDIIIGTFPNTFTINQVSTDYNYYNGSQKFPILTVSYNTQTVTSAFGPTITPSAEIRINASVLTGITNFNFDAINYTIYPNPATDAVNIHLINDKTEHVSVSVMNNLGQVVRSIDLGSAVEVKYLMNTSDLASGIYHVKTSIGYKTSTKKLIIQ